LAPRRRAGRPPGRGDRGGLSLDPRLRELARRAEHDPAAAAALAVDLERSGRRREAFLAWCALARRGDARAGAAADGWVRWSWNARAGAPPLRPEPPGAPPARGRGRRLRLPGLRHLLAATASVLYVEGLGDRPGGAGRVRALALPELRPAWQGAEDERWLGCRGDDAVLRDRESGDVVVRDAERGDVLARLAVGGPGGQTATVARDRLIVADREADAIRALDLGDDPGAPRWERPGEPSCNLGFDLYARDGVVVAGRYGTLTALALDDGAVRWRADAGAGLIVPSRLGKRHGDRQLVVPGGVLNRSESSNEEPGASSLAVLRWDGRVLWRGHRGGPSDGGAMAAGFPQGHLRLAACSAEHAAYVRLEERRPILEVVPLAALAALDLRQGFGSRLAFYRALSELDARPVDAGWSRPWPAEEPVGALLFAGERLLDARVDGPELSIRAHDAASGRPIGRPLRCRPELAATREVALVPRDDGTLLVLLSGWEELQALEVPLGPLLEPGR